MTMRRIAVLGASGSGKTWLAEQLTQAFTNANVNVEAVPQVHIDDDSPLLAGTLPHDVVLLLGLDLHPPSPPQMKADQALRQTLSDSRTPFHVIYGQGPNRLLNALQALKTAKPSGVDEAPSDKDSPASDAEPAKRKPWVWACEKCSDPVCEHRLLSDLLAKR